MSELPGMNDTYFRFEVLLNNLNWSVTYFAQKTDYSERQIRNWKTIGVPKVVLLYLELLNRLLNG